MSDIPIIGQQQQTFALCFHKNTISKIKTYENSIRWLMIAIYPALLDGTIECFPAVIGMWDDITQKAAMSGSSFNLNRTDLVTPEELGLTILLNPPVQTEQNLTEIEI